MRKFLIRKSAVAAMSVATAVAMLPSNVLAQNGGVDSQSADTTVDDSYTLVWEDEFDNGYLDTDSWNVETHDPGWVNAELQRYTSLDEGNIEVSDGTLKIKPHVTEAEAEETEEEEVEEVQEAEVTEVTVDFSVSEDKETDTAAIQVNFGKVGDSAEGVAAATVSLFDISLTDEEGNELLNDTGFDGSGWSVGITDPAAGSYQFADGKAVLTIDASGEANWNYQMQQGGISLKAGNYHFSVKATSNADRMTEISLLDPDNGWFWYGGNTAMIKGSAVSGGSGSSASSGKAGEITSGRITTQNKHDFTYGRFEARAKVPAGQGYLPAFWLMATDEGLYGQWPKCGEIDIMEVMGQNVSKSYHTIHYGYSSGTGHKENQGTKVLTDSNFADEFHTYAVEWDPGKMTWFVDGEEVYTTSDWYTGTDDDNQITYPAPFDQNFYVILNLAVGGSWVGYPDEDTYSHMNDDAYEIDYVRVYQRSAEAYEKMESEAKKPEAAPVTFREADETGNYVNNSEFKQEIGIDGSADADKDNWKFHTESDAAGATYVLSENGITITQDKAGSQTYSVQLKQENVPMYKGWEYELTFDAYSSEERDIVVDIEGPDRSWIRYFNDTTVTVGLEKQTYTFDFTMNEKTDANGSLEFNLGKQASTAPVTIDNVRLVHKSGEEAVEENVKVIRPDGNYIYNGSFDQGEKRLGYWEIDEADKANVSVTNQGNNRELKVVVPEGKTIKIRQSDLAPINKGTYDLSFNARTADDAAKNGLSVVVSGKEFAPELGGENGKYSKKISFEDNNTREDSYVEILFKEPGTYYLDNLFLTESALLKNGSFDAGIASFSPYIDGAAKANYVIDNMNGNDHTFAITIENTGSSQDWYIQLNQDGITLEEGKSYKLSFRIKSTLERTVKYCMQQFEGNWTNYSNTGNIQVGPEWQTVEAQFKMEYPTDTASRFNITMGAIDGVAITDKHDIYIDDISLIEIDEAQPGTGESGETVEPGTGEGGETVEPGTGEGGETVEPGTGESGETVEPGTGEGGETVEPGTGESGETVEPEPEPQPSVPSVPLTPAKPAPVVVAVQKVVKAVVKTVAKVVTSVVKSIFRLFW